MPPAVVMAHDQPANGWAVLWFSVNVASACGGKPFQSLASFAYPLAATWRRTLPRTQPGHPSSSTPSSVVRLYDGHAAPTVRFCWNRCVAWDWAGSPAG